VAVRHITIASVHLSCIASGNGERHCPQQAVLCDPSPLDWDRFPFLREWIHRHAAARVQVGGVSHAPRAFRLCAKQSIQMILSVSERY
jgi:hypothetical protein